MKIFLYIIAIVTLITSNLVANENCKNIPGFKKLGKESLEYVKCLGNKSKELGKQSLKKLNTESKLTDWIKKKLEK
jgi:hypothetical protein